MPFTKPSLAALVEREVSEVNARLTDGDARLPFSMLNVLSIVHAGAVHGLYGYLDWLSRQVLPDTAEAEYLERYASIWGIARKPAAVATGEVTFTGTNGTTIPAGTEISRRDGVRYATDEAVVISGGIATVASHAVVAGVAGNTAALTSLSLVTPVLNVNSTASTPTGFAGGADIEVDDDLRERLFDRLQFPPQGGAEADYAAWSLAVPGVTRVWVFPAEDGPGTVYVRFVADDDPGGPIPGAPLVAEVQAYIDERRPVTAVVTVEAPAPIAVDFTIEITPDNPDVRDAVDASLRDLLFREGVPGGTVLLSHIREAISIAAGEVDHALTAPAANLEYVGGQMPVMGTITWA